MWKNIRHIRQIRKYRGICKKPYVVFDRAGHLLEEKEDLVSELANEWLDRVEESTQ
jgi:hypothetical protein